MEIEFYTNMSEGYKAMAEENLVFADSALPLALENWPEWRTETAEMDANEKED